MQVPAEVLALEEQGKLRAALEQLPAEAHKAHRERLEKVILALDQAQLRQSLPDYGQARAALEGAYSALNTPNADDRFLLRVLIQNLRALERDEKAAADLTARELLRKGDLLFAAGKFAEAGKVYEDVAKREGKVFSATSQEARRRQYRAEAEQVLRQDAFWPEVAETLVSGARTIAQWIVYLLLLVLSAAALSFLYRMVAVRPGMDVRIQDLTAAGADRQSLSEALSRQLALRLQDQQDTLVRTVRIDDLPDLDGASVGNLGISVPGVGNLEALITTGAQVNFGPVTLNPRQLVMLVAALVRPRYEHSLVGYLVADASTTSLMVERVAARTGRTRAVRSSPDTRSEISRRTDRPERWHVDAPVGTARADLISSAAEQITFQLADWTFTENWPSYQCCLLARDALARNDQMLLSSQDRNKALTEAREYLQKSLQHDPTNWMARYNLATVLRKLGENDIALQHFTLLETAIQQEPPNSGSALDRFLGEHPDFCLNVQYNRAVCLSKSDRWNKHHEAIRTLNDILETIKPSTAPLTSGEKPDGSTHASR